MGDTDSHGETPSYTEIVRAQVDEKRDDRLRFRVTFAGRVPATLPEDSYMLVEFTIEHRKDRYTLYTEGKEQGWTAYLATGGRSEEVAGAVQISGETVVLQVPRKALGGVRRFVWHADSSWTHSSLTTTDFGFDSAPNDERASFPRRRSG